MTALAHPVPDGWAVGIPVEESEGNRSSMRQLVSDGWALQTPVVESEGKRSSMGQMVPAGWAVHTVPAGLVQTAPSMLGPWNHPTSHLIKCRGLNIEGAVRARHLILNRPHGAAPRARVFP